MISAINSSQQLVLSGRVYAIKHPTFQAISSQQITNAHKPKQNQNVNFKDKGYWYAVGGCTVAGLAGAGLTYFGIDTAISSLLLFGGGISAGFLLLAKGASIIDHFLKG